MNRVPQPFSIQDLKSVFPAIEFPQYQREPNIWSRQQKQRLIDSILRGFDIASVYFYEREDGVWECIDGRQRLNAVMSFLGANEEDKDDNGFQLRIESEISDVEMEFTALNGKTFRELEMLSSENSLAQMAIHSLMNYQVSVTVLSDSQSADQFNLQFLRLNLGTMVNAGEKLHAMVGSMRDLVFTSEKLGEHPFFERVSIPTRRFAKEQVAAQVALQAFSHFVSKEFTRGRYMDLQGFLKDNASISVDDPRIIRLAEVLDSLNGQFNREQLRLKNRAMVVSVVLLAWVRSVELGLANEDQELAKFVQSFTEKLVWQIDNLRQFAPDPDYDYLTEFQRHVTQASVERHAISRRHEILMDGYEFWLKHGRLKTSSG